MTTLNDRLLAAHAQDDRAALVRLYAEAADQANDVDATCFYLTHAYIFALEMGHAMADALYQRLDGYGRV